VPLATRPLGFYVFWRPSGEPAWRLNIESSEIAAPRNQREIIPMIVIERYGKTVVITGWRACVIGAVAVAVMTTVLAALAFLVLGIAVSMVAFLLIVMPAFAIVALVAWLFQPQRA
jgi:hypothetical protein